MGPKVAKLVETERKMVVPWGGGGAGGNRQLFSADIEFHSCKRT